MSGAGPWAIAAAVMNTGAVNTSSRDAFFMMMMSSLDAQRRSLGVARDSLLRDGRLHKKTTGRLERSKCRGCRRNRVGR